MKFKKINEKFSGFLKKMDVMDMGMIKWSAFAFALFLVSVWSSFGEWVLRTHWASFLALSLALAVRPIYRFFR